MPYNKFMLKQEYTERIKKILKKQLTKGEKVFIFGSSVSSERFGDVDLAIVSEQAMDFSVMLKIKDDLEESTLPYKFDVVEINQTNDPFRTHVMKGEKIWII
jgi:predicted nucleotidyltransferase